MKALKAFFSSILLLSQSEASSLKLQDWTTTDFVWNLGMTSQSDKGLAFRPYYFFKYPPQFYSFFYDDIKEGDLVWVPCKFISQFCHEVLPKIRHPFILIINDGDESFPTHSGFRSMNELNKFLNHPKIIHVFAQNYDFPYQHPKVSPIPIGIDFHTVAFKDSHDWGLKGSPAEQEQIINTLLNTFKPTYQRKKRAFVDFQHNDSMRGNLQRNKEFGEDRTQIFHKLLKTGLIDYSGKLPRAELWAKKGEYAFSISPPGNGLDCHRTWEDLVLGCIVIVKKTNIDPMFKDLPVISVNDWSEVNEDNLDKWLSIYGDAFTNPDYRYKLTHQYWMSHILKVKQDFFEKNL
jgi:hypothetical protein